VNGLNQYTSAGPATFAYDPNGNLASTVNAPWSTAYVYDVENRLVSATGTHNATLTYDPLGRLFQVSSGASIRRLVYDGDALIAEYDAAGTMPHRYIHGNDGGDDPLVWYHNAASGWRQLLFHDHQGSIVGVTDMFGNSIAANSYDPWGIPAPNNAGRFGYTGQAWVPELGLWYYKTRFYSPTTGRFLQVDPIGYGGGANLYAYVGNDPGNFADPSGLARVCSTATVTGSNVARTRCVDVDGNRNGNSRENDMSPKEMGRVRRSFGGYIQKVGRPNGSTVPDLASYQKPIGGNGADAAKNMISVISQFYGFLVSRSSVHQSWSNLGRIDVNQGPSRWAPAPAMLTDHGRLMTFTGKSLSAHPLQNIYSESYSNVARIFIHETIHGWPMPIPHMKVDALARRLLVNAGLGGEDCAATDGFPGC
jgi:RHS repeat-associated protein